MLYFYIMGIACMSMMMVSCVAIAGKCLCDSNYALGLFMLGVAYLPIIAIIGLLNELGILM